jgi:large subunit ribosomal protein L31
MLISADRARNPGGRPVVAARTGIRNGESDRRLDAPGGICYNRACSYLSVEEEPSMKPGIHPEYHEARITCSCGESFVTGSTKKAIRVEICSKCHPFYTGTRKFIDAEGRVQKFARKYGLKVQ